MRDYKFRGKRNDGAWAYGNLVTYFNKPAIQDYSHTNGEIFLVDPETVGQYTGMTDLTQEESYEGDIYINPFRGETIKYLLEWMPLHAKYGMKVIESDYVLIRGRTFPLSDYTKGDISIINLQKIGNRWDNPSLLEVTHES